MAIEFTVDHDETARTDEGTERLVGWIYFTARTKDGDFRARNVGGGTPQTLNLLPRKGWLKGDGHLYKDQTSNDPLRLVGNDPAWNLATLTYRVDFELMTQTGVPVKMPHTEFLAPATDMVLYLTRILPNSDQPVTLVSTWTFAENILNAKTFGIALLKLALLSDFFDQIGATDIGQALLAADDEASGQAALGGGTAGGAVFSSETTGEVRDTLLVPSDYDDGLSDTRVPIRGSVSADKLDSTLAAFYALVSAAVTSPYFQALVNGNVLNANNNTDATQKVAKFGTSLHYTNAEEPVYGLRVESNSGSTFVQVGGGSSTGNAATRTEFYNAANTTTTTGTLIAYIDTGGFSLANTADQTTDYEKAVFRYNSNVLELGHLFGGSGSARAMKMGVAAAAGGALARLLQIQNTAPFLTAAWGDTTIAGSMVSVTGGCLGSSGTQVALGITPTINQTSTAGYTGWLVNVIETAIGSGTNLLANLQLNGASKFTVDRLGNVYGNRFRSEVTPRTTTGATTTLTKDSAGTQVFIGTTTQTCKLPTTGVVAGESTFISNQSTGAVTVQSSAANTIDTLTTGQGHLYIALIDTPTTAAHWKAIG